MIHLKQWKTFNKKKFLCLRWFIRNRVDRTLSNTKKEVETDKTAGDKMHNPKP